MGADLDGAFPFQNVFPLSSLQLYYKDYLMLGAVVTKKVSKTSNKLRRQSL